MRKLILLDLPIGNIGDITDRVKQALIEGQFFICEDTRNFQQLMNALKIPTQGKKLMSFHDHSKTDAIQKIISLTGEEVYLVSDAGNPLLSDPAWPIVQYILSKGIALDVFPGPSSVTTALSLSGLPPCPFMFHGFLPRGDGPIKKELAKIKPIKGTHIFFEAPPRMKQTFIIAQELFPQTSMSITRELTKWHQTVHRVSEKVDNLDLTAKGEMVFLIYIDDYIYNFFNLNSMYS